MSHLFPITRIRQTHYSKLKTTAYLTDYEISM